MVSTTTRLAPDTLYCNRLQSGLDITAMNTESETKTSGRRLPPEERRAEILRAAKQLLDREGVQGFSLEAVAREAGVAASLPRHYFGSSIELLAAATIDAIQEVEHILRSRKKGISLKTRITSYLEVVRRYPWAHRVWMRSGEIHPSVDEIVQRSRKRIGEAIMGRSWDTMTDKERLQARGCTGFVEAIVSEWIEMETQDVDLILDTVTDWFSHVPKMEDSAAVVT